MKKLFLPLAVLFFFLAHFVWYSFVSYRFSAKLLLVPAFYFAFMSFTCKKNEKTFVILRRIATIVAALGIVFTACLCCFVYSEVSGDVPEGCDYVIILGAGIEDEEPSQTLADRLDRAVTYLNAHPECTAVVSGSQGKDEKVTEASVMKKYLVAHGIAQDRIIEEDKADNTSENMKYSKKLISELGGGSIAVISSDYHIFRARRLAESAGFSPVMVSAKTSSDTLFFNCLLREAFALVKAYLIFI